MGQARRTVILVSTLALMAAGLFTLAAMFQQRAASASATVSGELTPVTAALTGIRGLMRGLLHSRTWLLGWVTNLSGFVTQALALHLGSVAAVQPWMSTQLLFALPMSSVQHRRRPRRRDWLAAMCICAGLVVLLLTEGATPLTGRADRPRVLLAAVSAAGLAALLILVSRRLPTRTASMLVAVAAGLCFAMSAVFMKLTVVDLVDRGVLSTAVDWPGYCLAVSAVGGLLLEQVAFAAGPLPWAVAGMSVTNPVASFTVGLLAFQVPAPDGPWSLAGIAVAGALVALGIAGLAHSESVRRMYSDDGQMRPVAAGRAATADLREPSPSSRLSPGAAGG